MIDFNYVSIIYIIYHFCIVSSQLEQWILNKKFSLDVYILRTYIEISMDFNYLLCHACFAITTNFPILVCVEKWKLPSITSKHWFYCRCMSNCEWMEAAQISFRVNFIRFNGTEKHSAIYFCWNQITNCHAKFFLFSTFFIHESPHFLSLLSCIGEHLCLFNRVAIDWCPVRAALLGEVHQGCK